MTPQFVSFFFALLSLLVVAGIVGIIADLATSGSLGVARTLKPVSLELAAAIATTCMLGSLYMSEIANYTACRLCWVQRFFMYPAAIILIIAVFTKVAALKWIALGLASFGIVVSAYHRYDQYIGESGTFCDVNNPCSVRWINEFGFITIPTMAGIGFAGVITLILLNTRKVA
ncbi:MAG: disulfide bond formation protein B [Acidimicrobiales bacterium]|nr:disulfide bond formation protein B [Acidimicrobiales bacterium]